MIIKPGAKLLGVSERVMFGFRVVETVWNSTFYGLDFVLTSGVDGNHSRKSKHWIGDALNHRTRNVLERTVDEAQARSVLKLFHKKVVLALGGQDSEFDYVLEWEPWHGHLEFDPEVKP